MDEPAPADREGGERATIALPGPVRQRLLDWAAIALAALEPAQVPPSLTRVARFTPAKRARLGGPALASAINTDPAFRAAVAAVATRLMADQVDAAADLAGQAARAHLLRSADAGDLLAALRPADADRPDPAALRSAQRRIAVLERNLATVTAERDEARARLAEQTGPEVQRLRQRLRDQGMRLREAEDAAARAAAELAAQLGEVRTRLDAARREATDWERRAQSAGDRAAQAQQALSQTRKAADWTRATADRRLDLLLQTVEAAAMGLRRELDLQGGGADPADVHAAAITPMVRPESTTDPTRLQAWLSLPAAHLIVDGYNVTKSGFGELTLAQQRDRLVRGLAALAARTGADVSVVFDGAAVVVPALPGRGVRVLFSPAGVIADDVVRDMVAAEPSGRVVIVVSSDREVELGARDRGARTAPSTTLLALLGS